MTGPFGAALMNLCWRIDSKRLCGLVSCILVQPHPSLVPSTHLGHSCLSGTPREKQGGVTSITGRLYNALPVGFFLSFNLNSNNYVPHLFAFVAITHLS